MVRKIFKTGNSPATFLPREALQRLGLQAGEACIRLGEQAGFHFILVDAAAGIGRLHSYLGDLDCASRWLEGAPARAQEINPYNVPMAQAHLTELHLMKDEMDRRRH